MGKSIFRFYLQALFLLIWTPLHSQEYAVSVQHISTEEGLSNRFVKHIFQDSKGFMWFSTKDGVNRWDGNEIKVFSERNSVQKTMEGGDGDIWLGLGPFKESNTNIKSLDSPFLRVYNQKKDSLTEQYWWAMNACDGVIFLKNKKNNTIYTYDKELKYHPNLNSYIKGFNFNYRLFPISNDRFWLISSEHIRLLDLDGKQYKETKPALTTEIYEVDEEGHLLEKWFISNREKAQGEYHLRKISIDPSIPPIDTSFTNSEEGVFLSTQDFLFTKTTSKGVLWEKRGSQLKAFSPNKELLFDFKNISKPVGGGVILYIYLDDTENLWVGTQNGVYKISLEKSPFQKYLNKSDLGFSTRGILTLNDSTIMVHSYRGTKVVNIFNGQYTALPNTAEEYGLGMGTILTSDNLIYSGLDHKNSLLIYHLKKQTWEIIVQKGPPYSSPYLPYQDKQSNTIWIGGTKHLTTFNEEKKETFPIFLSGSEYQPSDTRHFYEDEKGLWVVSRKGLFLVDPIKKSILKHYCKLVGNFPCDQLNFLHKDKEGIFWIATQGFGLIRLDPSTGAYQILGREIGLLNLTIHAVYEDKQNRLWLPTEYGLALFDKDTKTTSIFLEEDGITHKEFNSFSHHQSKTGRLYFGSINGVTAFHPDSISVLRDLNVSHPLHITSLKVLDFNKEGQVEELVKKGKNKISNLILSPSNKSFSIQFAFLDYKNHANIKYAFKLAGLDKDWTYQEENNIRFAGLPYGDYTLHIKAKANNGLWSENEIELPISVLKPFYLNNTFLIASSLLFLLGLFTYFRYRTHTLKQNAAKLELQVALRTQTIEEQKEHLKQINKTKDRLYALIAHDIRGPISAFRGIARKINFLLEKKDISHAIKLAEFVEDSTENLNKLVDNLLQWAQQQEGKLPFHPDNHNIENLVKEVFGIFQIIADNKSIDLEYQGDPGLEIYGDPLMISTILRNFVDNALKFSYPDSKILIHAFKEEKHLVLSIKDQGKGIPKKQLDQIFSLKGRRTTEGTHGEVGTGLGTLLCKELLKTHNAKVRLESIVEQGTTVILHFPILLENAKVKVSS